MSQSHQQLETPRSLLPALPTDRRATITPHAHPAPSSSAEPPSPRIEGPPSPRTPVPLPAAPPSRPPLFLERGLRGPRPVAGRWDSWDSNTHRCTRAGGLSSCSGPRRPGPIPTASRGSASPVGFSGCTALGEGQRMLDSRWPQRLFVSSRMKPDQRCAQRH